MGLEEVVEFQATIDCSRHSRQRNEQPRQAPHTAPLAQVTQHTCASSEEQPKRLTVALWCAFPGFPLCRSRLSFFCCSLRLSGRGVPCTPAAAAAAAAALARFSSTAVASSTHSRCTSARSGKRRSGAEYAAAAATLEALSASEGADADAGAGLDIAAATRAE